MAQVTLKDALTYSYKNMTFIKGQPLSITHPDDLRYFKNNAHFDVQDDAPKFVPPRRAAPAKPVAEEPTEEDEAAELEAEAEEEVEAEEPAPPPTNKPKAAKPVYRKGQFMKGGKRA